MSGRTFKPIPEAGPLKLPAAIVHPDDPLPKTWRLFSTWSSRGQHGAWLVREIAGLPLKPEAKRYQRSGPGRTSYWCREADVVQVVYRRSASRRRTSHIGHALSIAADAANAAYVCDLEAVREQARLKLIQSARAQAARTQAAAPVRVALPAPDLEPLSSPPAPGLERARWLGERVTTLAPAFYAANKLPAHTARRAAARAVFARVDGYSPSRSVEDARYFGSAALELAGLNEYARRVLDQAEAPYNDDDEEADHAVL